MVMKLLVLAGLVALCSGSSIPLVPRDNSHYVEGESRYIWMPDADGVPLLVDLEAPVDEASIMNARNGSNNEYWLFTRRNPNTHQVITHNSPNTVWNSNFRANSPTKVIVHGLNNNGNSPVNTIIRPAFLAVQDCNVIVVDWRRAANSLYSVASSAVPGVGQNLGNFLNWLVLLTGANWNNIHLVGHSLGAHVVGNAGRTARARPTRVTGLDPAGPGWMNNNGALRASDGQYVEAIHTNGGGLGILNRVANADFYPNGGKSQPGCVTIFCSHSRAYELFASSVRTMHLVGRLCSNIEQAGNNQCTGSTLSMGNAVLNKRGNGIYGLTTGRDWPF